MSIKTYSKGKAEKLSANFESKEFDCHGLSCCSKTSIDDKLVEYVQKIREHFNKPVHISSGYRCPVHNSKPSVGGATGSRHVKGQAADIYIEDIAPKDIAQYAESIGILGIGLYETSKDGYFVHIDTRTTKSFWYGQAQQPRNTFQEKKKVDTSKVNTSAKEVETEIETPKQPQPIKNLTLRKGDEGKEVERLQNILKELGFDCKGIDGKFGANTQNAVIDFQKERNLTRDGICGPNTWTEIESFEQYEAVVVANLLNVRTGPSLNEQIKTTVRRNSKLIVVYHRDNWGKLKNNDGWVCLDYIKKN